MSLATITILTCNEKGSVPLSLEVLSIPGKGRLMTTGNLGPGIQDSIKIAISWLRAAHKDMGLSKNWCEINDIHIHFQSIDIYKDGGSAGLSIALGLIASLKRVPLTQFFAATGEICLSGQVKGVSIVSKKVESCLRDKISTIFLPRDNQEELTETNKNIHYVGSIQEAWSILIELLEGERL